uniref:Si:ch211-188c16.1 n=1 Tax=Hucho hucho TaxID=62062 RepID=A0A4W5KVS9_9TELE
MEQEEPINVKALRAKFQEEARAQAQARDQHRPAIAEKPRRLPPTVPGGQCSTLMSSIHSAVENKPVIPRVIFRDGTRVSGSKWPVSFPALVLQAIPPTPPHQNSLHNGGRDCTATAKKSFKDRHLPLVLPGLPLKEQKNDLPPHKEVPLPTKCKKKGLLLHHPFKSTKVSKVGGEPAEEPAYAGLTTNRHSGAPVEGLVMDRNKAEDRLPLQVEHSSTECPTSSPDITITTPSEGPGEDSSSMVSATQFFSTLEKGKKRFSPKHLLVYARPKSLRSNGVHLPDPSSTTDKGVHLPPLRPPRKLLPDRGSLGPLPMKPPRPPWVDLRCYHPTTEHHRVLTSAVEPEPCEDPRSEPPSIANPELVVLEFPDFELNSELETAEGNAFDLVALELEATEFGTPDHPVDLDLGVPDFLSPECELPSCEPPEIPSFDHRALTISSHHDLVLSEFLAQTWEFPASVLKPQVVSELSAEMVPVEPSFTEDTDHDFASVEFPHSGLKSSVCQQENYYETCDNVYEVVENTNMFTVSQNSRKRKGPPKSKTLHPYGDPHPAKEEPRMHIWPRNPCKEKQSPENHEDKDQKKREKHRLEKEKKEQKEREKKDNEMKKKFKVTGQEEAMYHARVTVASKVRKNDLPVKSGDTVSIIRTTNCPKGKWLARDANHKYGYISVMNVELNIKEMLELGKKAQAAGRGGTEGDTISIGSRSSHHHPMLHSSFTDDDEEWTLDEETLSPYMENRVHNQTDLMPDMLCSHASAHHTLSDGSIDDPHTQTRHEALQKLAIFFQNNKAGISDTAEDRVPTPTNAEAPSFLCVVEPPYSDQEVVFADFELLPPPVLYADFL